MILTKYHSHHVPYHMLLGMISPEVFILLDPSLSGIPNKIRLGMKIFLASKSEKNFLDLITPSNTEVVNLV